jgi:type II secretory pathway pseudopilin PulG
MTPHGARGATLIELLVALTLLGLAMSVVAALTIPVLAAFEAEPAAADAQQRARGTLQVLIDDVQRAGTGFLHETDAGPGLGLPALLPDAPRTGGWTVAPRANTLTAWHAPRGAAHGTTRAASAAGAAVVPLSRPAFCSAVTPTCGFAAGDEVVLYLPHGRFAVATIAQVDAPLDLRLASPLVEAWPAGTAVAAVTAHTYELRADPTTGLSQIVRRLGSGPPTPVVDFVRRFEVEWVGASGAPRVHLAPDGSEEHAIGAPAPPPPGVMGDAAWPPGENCAFFRDAAGGAHWRGAAGGVAPAPLAAASFGDGPWCPSPAAPVRWDADLARVDGVRVVLSIAVAVDTLRPAAALGLARRPGARLVPDLVLETTVRAGRRSGGM